MGGDGGGGGAGGNTGFGPNSKGTLGAAGLSEGQSAPGESSGPGGDGPGMFVPPPRAKVAPAPTTEATLAATASEQILDERAGVASGTSTGPITGTNSQSTSKTGKSKTPTGTTGGTTLLGSTANLTGKKTLLGQ